MIDLEDRVAPDALGPRLADELTAGGRFVMLIGLDERSVGGDGLAVEAIATRPDGTLARFRAALPLAAAAYPSITPLVPAAHWDERESRDLFGIVPVGHPDPRRLVLHERWPRGYHPLRKDVAAGVRPPEGERRFVPFEVHGEGVYQLPVGPIHAGIIEPGHFRFSAIGERVLHLDARLFFTHRGLEKLVEGRSFAATSPIVERACGVCAR
jgi:Ni,Fe-hydrogenase III component G